MQRNIRLDWQKLPDEIETWEVFDRGQALLFTITHIEEVEYKLEVASEPFDAEFTKSVGDYNTLGTAQAAVIGYIKRLDKLDFLSHGTGNRTNEAVAGSDGGE
jgi:hypothetical protein